MIISQKNNRKLIAGEFKVCGKLKIKLANRKMLNFILTFLIS